MKAIRSWCSAHVMPMTLGSFGSFGIVPQSGFRLPTTVGVDHRPQQDVCGGKAFYDEPMTHVLPEFVRDLIRRRGDLIPVGHSWATVLIADTTMVLILVGSILERPQSDLPAAMVAAALAIAPFLLFLVSGLKFSPALVWVTAWTAAAILLFATSTPVATDFAPLLLVLLAGMVGSQTQPVYGALAAASAAGLLIAAFVAHRLTEFPLYLSVLALGWLVGYFMWTQAQLLIRQQEMQTDLSEHAAADERRRIAREVHDVIAHSLSVTLLHVTGARHALQKDRDIDDAIGALTDAERLGRQAMADIRRTVGLLEAGPTKMAPEPGIADIPDLIDDFVSAGLPVTLRTEGRPEQVSGAVGLALYRIAQESLANIAKHAVASKTNVGVSISASTASLSVINDVPVTVAAASPSQSGRGLAGMRQRVELLGGILDAGPCRQGWSVRAEIPLNDSNSQTWRCGR
jgi:signal transduction histidine kinase